MKETRQEKTDRFIEKYLSVGNVGKGFGTFKMVKESTGIDHGGFAKRVRGMAYQEFLNTRYWQLVSMQVKHDAGCRCARCGSGGQLVVHHPDYRYLGYDMYHLGDLECLCRHCHEEIHGISRTRAHARTITK